jgi:hypothetical protein
MSILAEQKLHSHTPDNAITASFRDPAGRVFPWQGRILRSINPSGFAGFDAVMKSPCIASAIDRGKVVGIRILDKAEREEVRSDPAVASLCENPAGILVEHPRIPFPSFPYEWPAEMLHAAADVTLDLALQLLPEHIGLKDATPYNVLFRGPNPVFIDLLSFERREPRDPSWLPYA